MRRMVACGNFLLPWLAVGLLVAGCGAKETPMHANEAHRPSAMAIEDGLGLWRITSTRDGGKQDCVIALNGLAQPGSYGIHIETCSIPALAQLAGWRPIENGLQLLDASTAPIVAFGQYGIDEFRTNDGSLRMQRATLR